MRIVRHGRALAAAAATGALLFLIVAGTFSAWTQTAASSGNLIATAAQYDPPASNVPPAISGTERDGQTLTTSQGSWSGPGQPFTFGHQWLRCDTSGSGCVEIAGATGQSYVLTPADVPSGGRSIRVRVTATSIYGEESIESARTGTIQARPPVNQSLPTISGEPHENQTLTADPGSWDGTPPLDYLYQWQRCDVDGESCVDIENADTETYVVAETDQGSTFRVFVLAGNTSLPGGGQDGATSDPTAPATPIGDVASSLYAANGMVTGITRHEGNTYIAGLFTLVGKPTGGFGEIDADTASASLSFPAVTGGNVTTFEPDGAGGWYIGGTFTRVGSQARSRLAHILPDGTLDPVWQPSANGGVMEIRLDGSRVYVGGLFTTLGGQPRGRIGAVDAVSGAVTGWTADADGTVFSIVPNGTTLHVGGSFATISGVPRAHLAEVSAATGAATGFNPSPNGWVSTIERSGSTLYLAGSFTGFVNAGGLARGRAAAINLNTGFLTSWNPNFNDLVRELLLDGSRVYASGEFTTAGGASHPQLVGVDTAGGAVNWNPPDPAGAFTTGGAWGMDLEGTTLYVGGDFTTVGGESRRGLAAFDTSTAALTSWAPQASAGIHHVQHWEGKVLVGGDPGLDPLMLNTVDRVNAAAFDSEGEPTAWNPSPSGTPWAIETFSDRIIIGGDFATIGGQARPYLAAVDPDTGAAGPWNPSPNWYIRSLHASDGVLYVGGDFTTAAGQPRSRLAAFAEGTGALTSWAPVANTYVTTVFAADSGTVYLGGGFTTINGVPRTYAASITPAGGLGAWAPNPNSPVQAIYTPPGGGPIYVGGTFTTFGGIPRNYIAATDTSGSVTPWNPNANGPVVTIDGTAETIYAGGFFTAIGGQPRTYVAALRASDGTATSWAPNPDGFIQAVLRDSSGVHVGGYFRTVGDAAPSNYVHFK